jgi:hypothetical protein
MFLKKVQAFATAPVTIPAAVATMLSDKDPSPFDLWITREIIDSALLGHKFIAVNVSKYMRTIKMVGKMGEHHAKFYAYVQGLRSLGYTVETEAEDETRSDSFTVHWK